MCQEIYPNDCRVLCWRGYRHSSDDFAGALPRGTAKDGSKAAAWRSNDKRQSDRQRRNGYRCFPSATTQRSAEELQGYGAMKRKPQIDESFREDRNWHTTDAPDDSATLREKLEWQRKLEAQRQKAEKPSDLPEVDFDETRWWCIPGAISPEYQRQQMKRQIQRLQRKAA